MKLDFLYEFEFFTGVPDSQLRPLCDYLYSKFGVSGKHVIAANEGNAVGIAAGYHLSTGKIPVVYMQNSGEGNIINPLASLLNDKVYAIPCVFIIGWRGEPGVHDEPQHVFQGEVTCKLLEDMGVSYMIVSKDTGEDELKAKMAEFRKLLSLGKQVAFVVRKGALEFGEKIKYQNSNAMSREEIISHIVDVAKDDVIVSTTGKASRELFEIRERRGEGHERDFLTVGSMGHASSIALGIALQKPMKRIWVIDGDGALLMHMGSMALMGANGPSNLIHVVINNSSHETVGGQPTVADKIDIVKIAKACGYRFVKRVSAFSALDRALAKARRLSALSLIEVKCAIGAREDLGRPTTTPVENKESFMKFVLSD